jgi:6-phosphogluconate dehydrogenase
MSEAQFGMVGLGTMGRNFLLNVAEHGFSCVGYDLDSEKRDLLLSEGAGMPIEKADNVAEFVAKLAAPRNIMLLVPAGKIVDSVIADLLPHLEKGDLIIDGGNSHFTDTEIREAALAEKGIGFLGVGVSGGEEGARNGPSIMPGGDRAYYERIAPIFEAVAAKANGEPCVAYMGKGSAGHFVKMVHNGIEYGLMQILAEIYDLMHRVLKMDHAHMSEIFAGWNGSDLNSFLVEITAEVLRKTVADTGNPLVEMILDKAAQKGTGKWTSQAAMDLGVPIPTIDSAVSMRQISAQKETRALVSKKFGGTGFADDRSSGGDIASSVPTDDPKGLREHLATKTAATEHHEAIGAHAGISEKRVDSGTHRPDESVRDAFGEDLKHSLAELEAALLSSYVVTYAQGLSLLQIASAEKDYGLDIAEIAKIWRGGCIIRSALLDEMRRAYTEKPDLPNLILDDFFAKIIADSRESWHTVVSVFSQSRIPALCLSSALAYFEAFRSERLPANLIQAQRDFFGAHTYERTDKQGIFHTPDWSDE